jgi:SM-20-related protein
VWLSEIHPIEQAYLDAMDALKMQLNRQLFLGLRDFEAHFAHYPPGHFYQRHVDAFRGQSNRIVSSVFYLNPDWSEQDDGQLVLYKAGSDKPLQIVQPRFGSMVLFLSEQFPHEVRPARRDRYSIAGWFRTDNVL